MAIPHAFDRLESWLAAREEAGGFLLALDFDGTLSPIVARPEDAQILGPARDALRRILRRDDTTVAVVSGRALADVRARVGLDAVYYAGNHGMEIEGPGLRRVLAEASAARPALAACLERLAAALDGCDGVQLEDKGLTLSVHYRRATRPDAEAVVRAAVAAACRNTPLRWTTGKKVVEVRPPVDWDKGRATRFLLATLQPQDGADLPVVFIGDDRTDEDAFGALREDPRATVHEGVIVADDVADDTLAASYLHSPDDVAALLARLV